jgi:hypothetical protein
MQQNNKKTNKNNKAIQANLRRFSPDSTNGADNQRKAPNQEPVT